MLTCKRIYYLVFFVFFFLKKHFTEQYVKGIMVTQTNTQGGPTGNRSVKGQVHDNRCHADGVVEKYYLGSYTTF